MALLEFLSKDSWNMHWSTCPAPCDMCRLNLLTSDAYLYFMLFTEKNKASFLHKNITCQLLWLLSKKDFIYSHQLYCYFLQCWLLQHLNFLNQFQLFLESFAVLSYIKRWRKTKFKIILELRLSVKNTAMLYRDNQLLGW